MSIADGSSVLLMICGYKGLLFFESLVNILPIRAVVSYRDNWVEDFSFEEIQRLCLLKQISFFETRKMDLNELSTFDLIFVVGWQYLLPVSNRIIVFHDSLLPKYRGFAPTVNALINGEKEIGVTAFSPREGVDTGPIFQQLSVPITYPLKIKDAFKIQADLTAQIAITLFNKAQSAPLLSTEQNEMEATYSIWRDEKDYLIQWNISSERILRTIDALGWPYRGAQTFCGGEKISIIEAKSVFPRKKFVNISPGKIWSISYAGIEVLTGTDSILLTKVLDKNGNLFSPGKLRLRFDREVFK